MWGLVYHAVLLEILDWDRDMDMAILLVRVILYTFKTQGLILGHPCETKVLVPLNHECVVDMAILFITCKFVY